MTKCDFCTKYDPKKGCFWLSTVAREDDCEKAIQKMIKALKGMGSK